MLYDRNDAMAKKVVTMCQSEIKDVNYYYDGGIVAGGKTLHFWKIISFDLYRDFVANFTDVVNIEILMDVKEYYEYVLPNLENLRIWIRRRQMAENSMLFVRGGETDVSWYKGFVYNPPTMGLSTHTNVEKVVNPDLSMQKVEFQCVLESAVDIKLTTWAGLMELTVPSEGLKMVLDSIGENHGWQGVEMVPPDVNVPRQIIVPRGTYVKDLAHYMQQEYGIYNHGIGCYTFENEYGWFWWIYPLYNNMRYHKEYYKLTVCVVSSKWDPSGVPRTYMVDNGHITLFTFDQANLDNTKAQDSLNAGTGIQVLNGIQNLSETTSEVKPNQHVINGAVGMSTFNVVDRKDNLKNYVSVYENVNNMARLVSSVAGNGGNYITVQWRFANHDLLQPGMPVKVAYMDGKDYRELYGTLHAYQAVAVRQGNSDSEFPFNCSMMLKIFVTEIPDKAL